MVWPALRGLTGRGSDTDPEPWSFGRIGWSVVAAAAVLGLGLMSEVESIGGILVGVGILVTLIAVRPLLPPGALKARRGLPSVILLRGLVGASFLGAWHYGHARLHGLGRPEADRRAQAR